MPPSFEGHASGTLVKDDEGLVLGIARGGGRPLSSANALTQLGYESDPDTPSGVRRLGQQFLLGERLEPEMPAGDGWPFGA